MKPALAERYETGVTREGVKDLTRVSHLLDEILNRAPNRHQPYVGASAFAHKGGLHVSAVQKDPRTYEHIPPEWVGNERHVLVSDQAGRSNILSRLEAFGINLHADDPRVRLLLDQVKEREFLGYSYDGAEASFELLARRALGQVPEFFRVESFRVLVERRFDAMGRLKTVSEATVKLTIDGETFFSVGEGVGPVNALDQALRRDLGKYQRYIDDLELVDFKVRILTTGTEAVTRVLIESKDGKGKRWFTVGVSPNIVDASFEALADFDHLQALPRPRGRERGEDESEEGALKIFCSSIPDCRFARKRQGCRGAVDQTSIVRARAKIAQFRSPPGASRRPSAFPGEVAQSACRET